uniref:Uncharacterized protein n=1 Tax=Parascaris equorum TaxID=6256 RepID=A0A914S0A2_PAREQ
MPSFTFPTLPPLQPSYQTGPESAYNIPPSIFDSHQSPLTSLQSAPPLYQTPVPPAAAEPETPSPVAPENINVP